MFDLQAFNSDPEIVDDMRADMLAVRSRDPACKTYLQVCTLCLWLCWCLGSWTKAGLIGVNHACTLCCSLKLICWQEGGGTEVVCAAVLQCTAVLQFPHPMLT